jgi:hypothetical protein
MIAIGVQRLRTIMELGCYPFALPIEGRSHDEEMTLCEANASKPWTTLIEQSCSLPLQDAFGPYPNQALVSILLSLSEAPS